jgi:NAD-reducing hydrogenase large subunit
VSKTIFFKKATRIEGNANIHLQIDKGRVTAAHFMVPDFRGFEAFTKGKRVEFIPSIVCRICGLCSCSHFIASLKAIEDALSIPVPSSVQALREIILLSEWISSHSLSAFFLSLPDAFGAQGGVFELMRSHPEMAQTAMFLRNSGQKMANLLAKSASHPVAMTVGGFYRAPVKEEVQEVRTIAGQVKGRVAQILPQLEGMGVQATKQPLFIPEDQQANFLTTRSGNGKHREELRVYDASGELRHCFAPEALEDEIDEMTVRWSFAKFPYLSSEGFPKGIVLVGPLARAFQKSGALHHPDLQQLPAVMELKKRQAKDLPFFDVLRFLEIYWAADRIERLARRADLPEKRRKADLSGSGKGIGVVEAPRGVLVHNYLVHQGCIESMHLLVATQFNNALINLLIRDLADKYVNGDGLDPEGEKEISRCIRLFDPCISCATH